MSERDFRKTGSGSGKARSRYLLWAGIVILVVVLGWALLSYLSRPSAPRPSQEVAVEKPLLQREIILYFSAEDGSHLVAETCEIEECTAEEDCLRAAVQALIAGPTGSLVEVLPANTSLLGLQIDGPLVSIDFSADMVNGHPGGTQSELLTVYALTNTLTVNFPHLRQVRILVEGVPVETLKGHVDLRQPVSPDYSLVEEMSAPAGDLSNVPVRSE